MRSRFWDNWAVALCSSFKEEKKNKEWFNYVFCVAFRLVCSWHLRYKRNYEEKINVSVVTNQDLFHAALLCSTIVFLMRLHVPGLIQNEPVSFRSIFSVFAGSDFFRLVKYPAFDFLPRISFSSCLLLRYVDMPGQLLSHLFLGTLFSHTAIKRGRGNPTGIGWIMKNRAPFWNVVLTTLFVASFEFYVFFFCFDVGRADVSCGLLAARTLEINCEECLCFILISCWISPVQLRAAHYFTYHVALRIRRSLMSAGKALALVF